MKIVESKIADFPFCGEIDQVNMLAVKTHLGRLQFNEAKQIICQDAPQ